MRNLLNNSIIIISCMFILLGCRKDPQYIKQNDYNLCQCNVSCESFPPSGELGYLFTRSGNQYLSPQFNPNNQNEFIYIRTDKYLYNTELVRYNMLTKTEQVLNNSSYIISPPQWGNTGWIVFSDIDWKIWKIRDDGSDLTQLTFGVQDLSPHFNYSNDLIWYRRGALYSNAELDKNPDLYKETKMILTDINGNVKDSITAENTRNEMTGIFSYQTWGNPACITSDATYFFGGYEKEYGVYKLDLNTQQIFPIKIWKNIPLKGWALDMIYHDGKIMYSWFRNSIKTLDLNTGQVSEFKCGCATNFYDVMSVSADGKKLLVEKVISKANGTYIDEQHEIWLMDIDGCNEEKILGD